MMQVARAVRRVVAACAGLAVGLASAAALSSCAAANVVFDRAFRTCLNEALGQPADSPVTATQLRHLSSEPNCQNMGITSLEGAQYLTNARTLIVAQNKISDLTPLAHLSSLQRVFVGNNQIVDLTPLANLKSLIRLDADFNQISDLTALSGLTHLLTLSVEANQISDVSALGSLSALTTLGLDGNHIRDLTPIAELPAAHASDPLGFTAGSQSLTEFAVLYTPQPLPSVVGFEPVTWTVLRGAATIIGDMITYQTPGTVVLAFNNTSGARFSGVVTVTVT
ncbi:MAG: hypothetical protein FWF36_06535 [Propionibacteriaceae bacterium]|nr:hypothetical protein [Propionibacteriaceae bacterium]